MTGMNGSCMWAHRAVWLTLDSGEGLRTVCSNCRKEAREESPFCPNCGRMMGVMEIDEGKGTISELPQQQT